MSARQTYQTEPKSGLSRRTFIGAGAAGVGAAALGLRTDVGSATTEAARSASSTAGTAQAIRPFALDEVSLAQLSAAMADGSMTSREITQLYLDRIAEIDAGGPMLRAVLETNPDALDIAAERDRERAEGRVRGPLHGIPILLKDNIATADKMETTAGSLALVGAHSPEDSFVAARLRAAGAVLLGKANLSEWANMRGWWSSSGWSARGGLCVNPYDFGRTASGSSSGSAAAAAASLCAAAVGTETSGSIVSPSSTCGVVGLKPTVGLVSRSRIIPIADAFDTAGPMARTVRDAAILLGGITGVDPQDAKTAASTGNFHTDYQAFLSEDGLRGARIGVTRQFFSAILPAHQDLAEAAIQRIEQLGATIVDNVVLPNINTIGTPAYHVMSFEFKTLIARYLEGLGDATELRTIEDLIAFNEENADLEMPFFGQEEFHAAAERGGLDDPQYLEYLQRCETLSRTEGLDKVLAERQIDAIVSPFGGPATNVDLFFGEAWANFAWPGGLPAVSGYPHLVMPLGLIRGLPVAFSFIGGPWSEPSLLKYAYALEQAMEPRVAPQLLSTVTPPTPWQPRDRSCAYLPSLLAGVPASSSSIAAPAEAMQRAAGRGLRRAGAAGADTQVPVRHPSEGLR